MTDIPDLQRWVGKESTANDLLNPFAARALAAALGHAQLPAAGDPLPRAWHWIYFLDTPTAANTDKDGHPVGGSWLLPPPPLPRRMWAGGTLHLERPIVLGTPADKRSVIKSIESKTGKTGALVFLRVEHSITQKGELCVREEQTLVYREAATGPAAPAPGEPAPTGAEWTKTITPDPVLLFRYSALTYNGHRIHYDREYAKQAEHYPALVVHGPLLATFLSELLSSELPKADVKSFRFRAVRPTFDNAPFTVSGKRDGDAVELWTCDAEGNVGMSTRAVLR